MRLLYVLLFLSVCTPVKNNRGLSEHEKKKRQNEARILELKQKYPPDDYSWMYEISKRVRHTDEF